MKNPWKRYSKINPQRENGNRQICNDVFKAIIAGNFTGAEYKIIFSIIDKTWGYKKQAAALSIKHFIDLTNLDKRTVQRTIKKLKALRVVWMSPLKKGVTPGSPLNEYSFNKHYDTWQVETIKIGKGDIQTTPPQTVKGGADVAQGCHPDHPLPIKESIKESIKEIKKINKRKIPLPNNYKLENRHIEYANSKGIKTEIDDIFEAFCIYHCKVGSKFVSWYATWQTWIRNKAKWDKEKQEELSNGTKYKNIDFESIPGRNE